jgi:hypothetical protein
MIEYLDLLPIDRERGFCSQFMTAAKMRRLSCDNGTPSEIAAILSKIVALGITR